MRRALRLLELLADRNEHAGSELARALGVTRAAVWQQVAQLRAQGLDIAATRQRGYVLREGFEPLDAAAISAAYRAHGGSAALRCEVLAVTDSTNERLLEAQKTGDLHAQVLLAEHQTAGRGRRGDRWVSPPGAGLCLSLGWRFDAPPATFSALSLVVGIALASSLRRVGVAAAYLKWPNDVVCGHAKLAGILIEMRAEAGGPSDTVIGIGLNMRLSRDARAHIDQAVTDMYECGAHELARNRLAGLVLADLSVALDDFAEHGFAPYRARWAELDGLTGESVLVSLPGREVAGVARGVDEHGALVVEHAGGREIFLSGHVRRI